MLFIVVQPGGMKNGKKQHCSGGGEKLGFVPNILSAIVGRPGFGKNLRYKEKKKSRPLF